MFKNVVFFIKQKFDKNCFKKEACGNRLHFLKLKNVSKFLK